MLHRAPSTTQTTASIANFAVADECTTYAYSADTELGPVEISITGTELESPSTLNMMLELSRQESLLLTLEDWLGIGLDFHSQQMPVKRPALFSVRNSSADFQQIDVSIPVPLWAHKQAPLAEFDNIGIKTYWPDYHARLCLSALPFSNDDLDNLHPGSMVLLPDSFQHDWKVNLSVPALEYRQNGLLVKDVFCWQGMLEFPVHAQASQPIGSQTIASQSIAVQSIPSQSFASQATVSQLTAGYEDAGCYFELSTKHLLASPTELQDIINSTLKHSPITIRCRDGKRATANLLQIGSGYGLTITRLFGATQ